MGIVENNKKYIIREELFGYTFFDKPKLRHTFVLGENLDAFLKSRNLSMDDCKYLKAKRKDYRKDIIYSPIRIYYELTLACNLRCKSCFNRSGKPRAYELITEEVLKSLNDLREANVLDLRFTGGELTKRPDWFEILRFAKKLGFAVSCNTNATYLDDEINKKFADLDIEQVTVSIDGRKEHHEINRGSHTFDRTITNLKRMRELGVKLRINTLINKYSVDDLEYMLELASKYVTEINFFITRFIGRGGEFKNDGNLATFEQFYEMSKQANKLRPKYPNLNILHFEQATVDNSSRSGTYDDFGLKVGPPDGSTRFNIMSDGSLWAGGYIPYVDASYELGNIKTDDIYDVWQKSEKLEQFREEARGLELFCRECDKYGKTCPGPNFELELLREKDRTITNPYCFYGTGPSLLQVIEDKENDR